MMRKLGCILIKALVANSQSSLNFTWLHLCIVSILYWIYCIATTINFDIIFIVALPVIIKQPKSVVVQAYSVASFVCAARSYGTVSITWKRLNSELPITAQIRESKSLNEITSTLSLESIGYYEGHYYCVIENSAGIVNSRLAHFEISGMWIHS